MNSFRKVIRRDSGSKPKFSSPRKSDWVTFRQDIPEKYNPNLPDLSMNKLGRAVQRSMFAMVVITSELAKSIKNAPTTGTTRNASGAGPYFSTSSSMQATAFAVMPSM